ncbi:MAG: CHAT domain-containing protein [Planctomycetota bacterium]
MSGELLADLLRALAAASTPRAARAALRAVDDPDGILGAWRARILHESRSDPVGAARESRWACVLAVRAADRVLQRAIWRARAAVELLGGRPRSALRALRRARQTPDLPERAQSAVLTAHVLGELGRVEEAEDVLEEARPLAEARGDVPRLCLLDLARVGLLERQERFPEALAQLEDIERRLLPEHEQSPLLLNVRSNLANVLTQLSEYERADATYEWLEAQHAERGELLSVLQVAYNRTYVSTLRGRYHAALRDLEALEARARDLGDERHAALCALDRAEVELRLGLVQEAASSAEASARILERLGHERDAARALWFQAVALLGRDEVPRAVGLLRRASERLARLHSPIWAALGEHQLAVALRRDGHEDAAARHARRAAQSLYRLGLLERGGNAELLEAALERDRGLFERSYERLVGLQARLGDTYAPWLRCDLHDALACCLEGMGDLVGARREVLRALELLETHRLGAPPDEYMSSFLDQRAQMTERAVRLLAEGGEAQRPRVFNVIEGSKSRALLDMLRAGRHRTVSASSAAEAQLDGIEREIDGLGRLRWSDDPRHAEAEARRRASALAVRHERLRASLEALADREGEERSWHRRPVGLEEARAALDADTSLLTMHLGRDALFLGVLDRDGFELVRRPFGTWHARRLVRRLAFHLDRPAVVFDAYEEADRQLVTRAEDVLASGWDELIGPVRDRLGRRRLVIVPHGALHAVPFHALMPEPDAEPLLTSHDVVTAPSVSVYVHAQTLAVGRGRGVAAFGVPDEDAPLVLDEARHVAASWPQAQLATGAGATRDALLDALSSCSVVHVASHGVFDDDDPLRAGVRLGDGWLRTSDLYGRDVRCDIVLLSGCVTGRLAVHAADEPMGLVRGFLAAGARQIVNTLWHVTDRPALDLMVGLHAGLARGLATSAALRDAALAVRARHPHPAHWAPFALLGAHDGSRTQRSGS